ARSLTLRTAAAGGGSSELPPQVAERERRERCSPSSGGSAQQARRARQEDEGHQRENRHLSELRKQQACQAIDHANQQSAGNRAPVAAQATDDHRDEREDKDL